MDSKLEEIEKAKLNSYQQKYLHSMIKIAFHVYGGIPLIGFLIGFWGF